MIEPELDLSKLRDVIDFEVDYIIRSMRRNFLKRIKKLKY